LQKSIFVEAVFINLFNIYQKIYLPSQVSGRISGTRPLQDIRPDIRYPAKTASGASLFITQLLSSNQFCKSGSGSLSTGSCRNDNIKPSHPRTLINCRNSLKIELGVYRDTEKTTSESMKHHVSRNVLNISDTCIRCIFRIQKISDKSNWF
jgi:hypothetical protein